MTALEAERNENLEQARLKIVADNDRQLQDMKIGLDLEMAEEERKINAMLENKRDEVM